jgi:hypothetical protein
MEILILVCTILSVVFGLMGFGLALFSFIELQAMKKSTHKLEYVPVNVPEFSAKQDKEFKETLNEDFSSSFIL